MKASPKITRTRLDRLRPTQASVGYAEVARKRRDRAQVAKAGRLAFLGDHALPAVMDPGERSFISHHHHLARALHEEEVETVFVSVSRDLSDLSLDEFRVVMDRLQWVYPYDADGQPWPFDAMPRKLSKVTDDPDHSLAAQVRRAGGYARDTAPFAEVLWADFFRRARKLLDDAPKAALVQALGLSHSLRAEHLPGWSGGARPA